MNLAPEVENEEIALLTIEESSCSETTKECPISIGQTVRLGRDRGSDLVLQDRDVSRTHATITASFSGLVLNDLGSLNGTFVNRRRITTPYQLADGDLISVGSYSLRVHLTRFLHPESPPTSSLTVLSEMRSVEMTLLLADICGYTRLTQHYSTQVVVPTLHRWFESVSQIVKEYGGEVDKYIGDCVMARWHSPVANAAASAKQAVEAGVAIQEATAAVAKSGVWQHQEEHPWKCRVVLNSGTALLGALGSAVSREFTVLGDMINMTFRLESVANNLGSDFILGQSSAALVRGVFPVRTLGMVQLEGREHPVEAFTLETP